MSQEITFKPNAGQQRVLTSQAQFIFAMGGKRAGKTTTGCYWAYTQIEYAMKKTGKPTRGLIAAPIYDQLHQSTLQELFKNFPFLRKYYMKADKKFVFPNGSEVICRSMDDPSKLEGLELDWFWLDEGDGMSKIAWEFVRGRVSTGTGYYIDLRTGEVTTKRGGRGIVTTTIYANSWIYTDIVQNPSQDYEVIRWHSIDNPAFPREEWDRLQRELDPITFARNYLSEFVFSGGQVFPGLEHCFIDVMPVKPALIIQGIDFGMSDPTVIITFAYGEDGIWYMVDERYSAEYKIQDIINQLDQLSRDHGKPFATYYDYAGGIAITALPPSCNPRKADKRIDNGLATMRELISSGKFKILNRCVNAKREFSYYSFKPNGDPIDYDNHTIDAARYAVQTAMYTDYVHMMRLTKETKKEWNSFWQSLIDEGLMTEDGIIKPTENNTDNWFNDDDY